MSYMEQIKPLQKFESGNFFVVYGRPSSGKTHFAGTFPTPLFISYKDKGLTTVSNVKGDYIEFDDGFQQHMQLLEELKQDTVHQTIVFDTFGVYIDRLQQFILDFYHKKSMTQQMWGDIVTQVKMLLDGMKELSKSKNIIVTFHESPEVIEGYEDEITPSVGCFVSAGVKKALYGITNYALHTFIYNYVEPNTNKSIPVFAMHVGTNPYFWTKFQKAPGSKPLPELIFNPDYEQIQQLRKGE